MTNALYLVLTSNSQYANASPFQLNFEFMKEIAQDMIIQYKQLSLLEDIGQGRPEVLKVQSF